MTTGTVQDKGGKEFYTIKTKSDKVFYLIVDKDKTDENVYLLTEVGENDLLNFTDTNMVTLPQNQAIAESALPLETEKITETPEPEVTIIPEEKEEPEKKSNNSGTILLMLLVLAGVCGAYYYWKFMKGRNTSFDYEEDEDDDEDEHEHHHDHDDDDHDHDCCHHHDDEDEHEHHHEHHYDEHGVCSCGHHHHHDHDADEVFTSWGKETAHKYSREDLDKALHALDEGAYGMILRAKGIVDGGDTWYEFDMVPGEHEIRPCGPDVTGKLCVIGSQLKEHEIAELFHV